jgi:hypothetical protein
MASANPILRTLLRFKFSFASLSGVSRQSKTLVFHSGPDCLIWLTSDVLNVRQALPVCPRFQTYCCLAANDVQGHKRTCEAVYAK